MQSGASHGADPISIEPVTGFLDAQAIWSWGEKGSKSTISNFFRATSSDLKNATAEGVRLWNELKGPTILGDPTYFVTPGMKRYVHGALALGVAKYLDGEDSSAIYNQVKKIVMEYCFTFEKHECILRKRVAEAEGGGPLLKQAMILSLEPSGTELEVRDWFSAEQEKVRAKCAAEFEAYQLKAMAQSTEANLKYCELALSRKKQTVHSIFISAEGTAAMKELSKVEKMLKDASVKVEELVQMKSQGVEGALTREFKDKLKLMEIHLDQLEEKHLDAIQSQGLEDDIEANFVRDRRKGLRSILENLRGQMLSVGEAVPVIEG